MKVQIIYRIQERKISNHRLQIIQECKASLAKDDQELENHFIKISKHSSNKLMYLKCNKIHTI